jgi:fructokinase
MTYRIGFDLGGTKLKVVVLNDHNSVVYEDTTATPMQPADIYNCFSIMYQEAVAKIDFADHTIGVGIPGNAVRPTYLLEGTNIPEELFNRFNRICKIDNDANCFTWGEAILGAGRGASSVFGVILGTGVGGGIVVNGKLYPGHSGLAAEWGHVPLYSNGPMCWCGQQGCAEQYISGRAIEKKYRVNTDQPELDAASIFNANDLVSLAVKHEFYQDLARGLANIINYYDPEVVVIGGGLSNHNEIYQVVPGKVEPLIFNKELRTRIVQSELGDSSGAIGAALL